MRCSFERTCRLGLVGPGNDGHDGGSRRYPTSARGLSLRASVRWITTVAGLYSFTVSSPWKEGVAGEYEISLQTAEQPSEEDRARVRAALLLDEAMRLRAQGTAESLKLARG